MYAHTAIDPAPHQTRSPTGTPSGFAATPTDRPPVTVPTSASGEDAVVDLPTPDPVVRAKVKELLEKSDGFAQLAPSQQKQVARDTALIADALVGNAGPGMTPPSGVPASAMNDQFKEGQKAVSAIADDTFSADAAREGAAVAAEFVNQVNFVEFVSGLIDGVFNSIVSSNIQQMEAYSKMVADVSKSLNQFRDENTTDDDGRDQLVEQFPDVFDIGIDDFGGSNQPTLRIRDEVDQDTALARVRETLGGLVEGGIDSIDVADPEAEAKLVKAARSHIATTRQQLLATMVMMGLSRIVVTNGKIQAKILYDFNASSQRTVSRSAVARDYARKADGSLDTLTDIDQEWDNGGTTSFDGEKRAGSRYGGRYSNFKGTYDSDYYTKGKYKYAQKPVMTAQSVASDQQDDSLTAKASLAGNVEVNFKSDYLPLEKMATPGMIEAIQMRSKPVDHNRPQYKPTEADAAQQSQTEAPAE